MVRALVIFCLLGWSDGGASSHAAGVVALDAAPLRGGDEQRGDVVPGTLVRELARQAFLVAARDELGMMTSDATLRQRPGADAAAVELSMVVDARSSGECTVRIERVEGETREEVAAPTFTFTAGPRDAYQTLLPQFEAASRDAFVDVLRDLEIEIGEPLPAVTELSVEYAGRIEEIDALLNEASIVSQYMAVRLAHEAIAKWGQSPEALQRLVRGYAHLGVLTEAHWTTVTNAMKARSLAYAQRLATAYPEFATARWSRAYANAMAGIHAAALDEVAELAAEDDADDAPAWTRLIAPFCSFDLEELKKVGDEEESLAAVASMLGLWAAAGTGEDRSLVDAALDGGRMHHCPEAYNLVYLLGQEGPVGVRHMTEYAAMHGAVLGIPSRLRRTNGIADDVIDTLPEEGERGGDYTFWPRMTAALREQDSYEFDGQILATLLEDTGVCLAATVLSSHQTAYQEHPLDDVIEQLMPLVEGHAAEAYFRLVLPLRNKDDAAVRNITRDLSFAEPSRWMYPALYVMWYVKNARGEEIGRAGYRAAERDYTCLNLSLATRTTNDDGDAKRRLMSELQGVSPKSPLALLYEIRVDHEDAAVVPAERLAEWEKRAGDHAGPWRELGALYNKREALDDALRCYETSFVLLPDSAPLYAMAWIYERQEKFDLVVPTLERYLAVEDRGLGHSNIHAYIANYFVRRKQFDDAKPHALEAAQSYSSHGLGVAATVFELAGDRDGADQWFAEWSRAYPTHNGREWFFYRARAGLPASAGAKALAEQYFGDAAKREHEDSGWWPAGYYALDGDLEGAIRIAKLRAEKTPGAYGECAVLVLALEHGDDELHKAALARLVRLTGAHDKDNAKSDARFARVIETLLTAETADELPTAEMDALLTDQDATVGGCNTAYFFGKLALLRHFDETAKTYLKRAKEMNATDRISWSLACAELAKLEPAAEPGGDADAEETPAEDAADDPEDDTI